MKLLFLCSVLTSTAAWQPLRVQYGDLVAGTTAIRSALQESGLLIVQNVGASDLHALPHCLQHSALTQTTRLPGAVDRSTIATHTVPGGRQRMHHETIECQAFNVQADRLRQAGSASGDYAFDSFANVVENGPHLEHFHSYSSSSSSPNILQGKKKDVTVEWHTDQGLFIVFTPARWASTGETTQGFFVQLKDGSQQEVQFSSADDFVIMLGDGVNQVVNPALAAANQVEDTTPLYVTPHAVHMPTNNKNDSRVWFGLMVLPPLTAQHPLHKGETFGTIRDKIVNDQESPLGCSHESATRRLQTTSCEDKEGTILCWHRCMSVAEQGVSNEICTEQGLDLWCINPRRQLWDNTHGDFFPGCVDSETAEVHSPFPKLPNYPRDDEECTDFEGFAVDDMYDHNVELTESCTFQYKVSDGRVQGKLSYSGIFGYIAIGFSNPGGEKKGMHGAPVIFATPGGAYSAETGLDLSLGTQVDEYVIPEDSEMAAYRHWSDDARGTADARSSGVKTMHVESNDCYTSLTFDTASIHNQKFQTDSSDVMIWAVNTEDSFCGHHDARGNFTVEWSTGKVGANAPPEATTSAAISLTSTGTLLLSMVVLLSIVFL